MALRDLFKKDPLKKDIKKLAKNSVRLKMSNSLLNSSSQSKFGGRPLLPENFEWPTFRSYDDNITRPLSFFCQINLAEVKQYDKDNMLPEKGIMSFFYECESSCWGFDPRDNGSARVFYFEDISSLIETPLPEDLPEEYIIPQRKIEFIPEVSYPMFEEYDALKDEDCDFEDYDEALGKLGVDTDDIPERHKLLGYADIIQSEMLTDCERAFRRLYSGDAESYRNTPQELKMDIREKAKDWILLLQLSTIKTDDYEWMFGDCGMLYYYIRKDDLKNCRFENMWFSLQCY
ncbi:MAG: DUF1963 domain-containing protein [Eubacteriaceae bacterium]|nr:DUF1963 domain-containing protein [Eubacteriaceae bacterium]